MEPPGSHFTLADESPATVLGGGVKAAKLVAGALEQSQDDVTPFESRRHLRPTAVNHSTHHTGDGSSPERQVFLQPGRRNRRFLANVSSSLLLSNNNVAILLHREGAATAAAAHTCCRWPTMVRMCVWLSASMSLMGCEDTADRSDPKAASPCVGRLWASARTFS